MWAALGPLPLICVPGGIRAGLGSAKLSKCRLRSRHSQPQPGELAQLSSAQLPRCAVPVVRGPGRVQPCSDLLCDLGRVSIFLDLGSLICLHRHVSPSQGVSVST